VAGIVLMGKRLVKPVIEAMARAIQEFEGWYEGSRSWRNNNPGNLKYAGQPGATGQDEQGHAIFDSFQSGWNALIRQLEAAFFGKSAVYSPADSLYSFFHKYAEGNSEEYARFVADYLHVTPETTLAELLL
jgi:hypothetical protein